jgi:7 transmembrane receptor (rhodopsin family)
VGQFTCHISADLLCAGKIAAMNNETTFTWQLSRHTTTVKDGWTVRLRGSDMEVNRLNIAGVIIPLLALVILDLVVIIGNSLVVTAVFTHAKLRRSITNRFVVSLAVADLMVGMAVLPFSSVNEVGTHMV